MPEILAYPFMQRAILASALIALICAFIGTYIVTRRMVFMSGSISHASFGGLGLAYFMGIPPLAGAALVSLAAGLGIEYLQSRNILRSDSSMGIFWSFGMAAGIILIYLTPGYTPNLMSYLFGSILTIHIFELLLAALLAFFVGVLYLFFYREILYTAFDEEFAKTQAMPVRMIKYTLMAVLALTLVLLIRLVGIILVISLLTLPQVTAERLTDSYKHIILLSGIIGTAGAWAGLFLSYLLDLPSGATIILSLFAIYLSVLALTGIRKATGRAAALRNGDSG